MSQNEKNAYADLTPDVSISSEQASRWFWGVAIIYGIIWTVLPFFLEPNFRLDVIEMFFIGKEGVVSTYKHPALNSAVLEIVYQRLGYIAPYLLNQICFITTAWSVWRLGREFLSPVKAVFGALVVFGYWANTYASLNYNHNVTLFPVWGLIVLFAFKSLKYNRYLDWSLLGLFIGIAAHCKYTFVPLVAAILIFMAVNRSTRKYWIQPGPYLTTLIALFIAVPQIVWLVQSDWSCLKFSGVYYGLEKTFSNRVKVFWKTIQFWPIFLSSFYVLLSPFIGFRWKLQPLENEQKFARDFLLAIVIIPILIQLYAFLATPFYVGIGSVAHNGIHLGPLLLLLFKADFRPRAVQRGWLVFGLTMFGLIAGYLAHNTASYGRSDDFVSFICPGRDIAVQAEKIWHERYDVPLPYVSGEWFLAGNVAIYGKDRPSVLCHSNNTVFFSKSFPLSNWGSFQDMKKHGGLVVWNTATQSPNTQTTLRQTFPGIQLDIDPIYVQWKNRLESTPIGIGIVPPDPSIQPEKNTPVPWHYFYPTGALSDE